MANLITIQNKIYEIRGQSIMLDFDIAELYGVETKRLNEQVKRNSDRFPGDFMFRLNKKEWDLVRSQIATSSGMGRKAKSSQNATSLRKHRGKSYLPYAFTEHGVTMLANVLKSKKAIKMSIAVVRAFIALKQIALQHKDVAARLQELRKELHGRIDAHDVQLKAIYDVPIAIGKNLLDEKIDNKIEENKWKERERIGYK